MGSRPRRAAWHASAAKDAYVFTRLGGYSGTFPTNGFTTSVDIYLDMSQNKSVGTDLRFDWDSAISNASGGYGRDFVFNVGTNPAVAGQFLVSASNNADWAPGTAFPADALTISESGWYTFKHTFKNVGGQLTVDMSVVNAGGTVLKTWTLSPAGDIVGQTIGGNRYAWLATNDFDDARARQRHPGHELRPASTTSARLRVTTSSLGQRTKTGVSARRPRFLCVRAPPSVEVAELRRADEPVSVREPVGSPRDERQRRGARPGTCKGTTQRAPRTNRSRFRRTDADRLRTRRSPPRPAPVARRP